MMSTHSLAAQAVAQQNDAFAYPLGEWEYAEASRRREIAMYERLGEIQLLLVELGMNQ